MKITLHFLMLFLLLCAPGVSALTPSATPWTPWAKSSGQDANTPPDPKEEMDRAIVRVMEIVNQPITHLPMTEWSVATVIRGGWFHKGARKPDFDTVDVRTTQQFPYAAYEHVTSNLNPGEMFLGKELEFNQTLQYFYKNRTLPKKRLTESEMLEINGLFRIIGRDDKLVREGEPVPMAFDGVMNSWCGPAIELFLLMAVGIIAYRKLFVPPAVRR